MQMGSFIRAETLGECRKLLPEGANVYLELEYAEGLLPILKKELDFRSVEGGVESGHSSLLFGGKVSPSKLLALQTPSQLFVNISVPAKRPSAFLGEAFGPVFKLLGSRVRASKLFSAIRVEAAGKDSNLMSRVSELIGKLTGLPIDPTNGDLVVRIRHLKAKSDQWSLAFRATPRPLTVRKYRVKNVRGSLDAALAAGMCYLGHTQSSDNILGLMCGSGTHLLECANIYPKASIVGIDINPEILSVARLNLGNLFLKGRVALIKGDAQLLPFREHSFDLVLCNPPWGEGVDLIGDGAELYQDLLEQVGRVMKKSGRLVLITQQDELFEKIVASKARFKILERHKVFQGGYRPVIFLVSR